MHKTLLAVITAFAMLISVNLQKGSVFPYAGRHEAYLLKNSSSCQILSLSGEEVNERLFSLFRLKGESVTLDRMEDAEKIVRRYHARLLFEESAEGVRSVYYYTPKLRGYKLINGEKVNLHIAYAAGRTVVGTPILFGGY